MRLMQYCYQAHLLIWPSCDIYIHVHTITAMIIVDNGILPDYSIHYLEAND